MIVALNLVDYLGNGFVKNEDIRERILALVFMVADCLLSDVWQAILAGLGLGCDDRGMFGSVL